MLEKNKKTKEINIFHNIQNPMDLLLPDVLQEKQDYICLGYNKYSRIFVITVYPEQTWISWLDDLFYIGNINISVKYPFNLRLFYRIRRQIKAFFLHI